MKICIKCLIEKPLSDFVKDKAMSQGCRNKCKICSNEEQKIRDSKNRDHINKRTKIYRDRNKEHISEMRKIHYQNNIDKMRKEKRKYINKSKKALYDIEYRKKNKEKIAAYKKSWDKSNESLEYKIKKNLRRRVHHALKGKTKSKATMSLIGCTPSFFISYISSLFVDNMSWDNYGEWHIDHIKPCFSFDLSIVEQQEECFHYSNQRPLWAIDNLKRPKSI